MHYRVQSFRRLMLGCQKGKNGRETTEKRQTIVQKRLVRQRKHCLSLARKSFKKQGEYFIRENMALGENGKPEIFAEYFRSPVFGYKIFSRFFETLPSQRKTMLSLSNQSFLHDCLPFFCGFSAIFTLLAFEH